VRPYWFSIQMARSPPASSTALARMSSRFSGYVVFDGLCSQFIETKCFTEQAENLRLRQPRREVAGFSADHVAQLEAHCTDATAGNLG